MVLEMSRWRDILAMSRHERTGALVVLAFIAAVIVMTWAVKTCSSSPPRELQQELLEWKQATDSTCRQAERRDSAQHAQKAARRDSHKKKDKPSKQKRNAPQQPAGLPAEIPNY